jgi:S1-C subfamily serine protease
MIAWDTMQVSASKSPSGLVALSRELADSVRQAGRSVVTVYGCEGLASSGVHWRRGVIVTADHALDRDEEIRVELPDGGAVRGMLVGRDPRTDLAVLRIRAIGLPTARFGDAASLQIGHMVLAVGRHSERGLSASWGVISGFGRRRASAVGGKQSIYLDLTIYPGFSGGPLIADSGRILGINTLGSGGVALSIANAVVEDVVGDLLHEGRARRD